MRDVEKANAFPVCLAGIMRHIRTNKAALVCFHAMPPSHKREYIGYIQEAKKPETRKLRIEKSITIMVQW